MPSGTLAPKFDAIECGTSRTLKLNHVKATMVGFESQSVQRPKQ
jgi:hypothetical protein